MYQSVFSELPGFFNLRGQKLLLKQAASILFPVVSWCVCVLGTTALSLSKFPTELQRCIRSPVHFSMHDLPSAKAKTLTYLKKKNSIRLCAAQQIVHYQFTHQTKCFFPVCLYQLFMKSIKVVSIEKPLFVTRIDETGRTEERESRDILVVNYTDDSHDKNQTHL